MKLKARNQSNRPAIRAQTSRPMSTSEFAIVTARLDEMLVQLMRLARAVETLTQDGTRPAPGSRDRQPQVPELAR